MNVSSEAKRIVLDHYDPVDVRTWPYFPIIMPLKDGYGPADAEDCDKITWEVWDPLCDSYGSFACLSDAINTAIRLTLQFIEETK